MRWALQETPLTLPVASVGQDISLHFINPINYRNVQSFIKVLPERELPWRAHCLRSPPRFLMAAGVGGSGRNWAPWVQREGLPWNPHPPPANSVPQTGGTWDTPRVTADGGGLVGPCSRGNQCLNEALLSRDRLILEPKKRNRRAGTLRVHCFPTLEALLPFPAVEMDTFRRSRLVITEASLGHAPSLVFSIH